MCIYIYSYCILEYSNYSAMFYTITLTPTPDPDRRTAPKWRSFARNLITHCSPLAPHLRRGAGVGQNWNRLSDAENAAFKSPTCSSCILSKFGAFWSCSTSSGSCLRRQVREGPFTYRFTMEILDAPHRRPKRLILGRLFDGGLLDMQESSVLDWVGSVDLVVKMLHPI